MGEAYLTGEREQVSLIGLLQGSGEIMNVWVVCKLQSSMQILYKVDHLLVLILLSKRKKRQGGGFEGIVSA